MFAPHIYAYFNADDKYFMFKTNKYSTWYFNIISNANAARRIKSAIAGYYESHHIIPKSFGGRHSKSNRVLLTPREHFLCHLLLPKMMVDPIKQGKMIYAFFRMKDKHQNSKLFDRFRTSYGMLTRGTGNPFYGQRHTPETLLKISGPNHHMYNKRHSAESIQKMKDVRVGKGKGADNSMFGKTHTEDWRKEHSASMSGEKHFNYGKPSFCSGRIWVNNSTISKMVNPDSLSELLSSGWSKGRLPK